MARRILLETMRLHPPAWWIARAVIADEYLGGYRIPAASTVVVSQYVTHRHPELWPDALRFDPDRFTDQAVATRPSMAYFPFGDGPRGCIGEHFAVLQLLLVMIAQRYELSRLANHEIQMWPVITMRPTPAVMMHVDQRRRTTPDGLHDGVSPAAS